VQLLNNNGWSSGTHGFISGATNPLMRGTTDIDATTNSSRAAIYTSVYVFPFASDTTKKAYDNALFAGQRYAEGWI
jgi:vacuolar-type H+-ATPase catalytic subunit A/Vma1